MELFMKLPVGIGNREDRERHVLKLKKNLYGQKQAARVWGLHLKEKLENIGFQQSKIDDCVFYKGKTIFMNYVDDGIFMSPDPKEIDTAIKAIGKQGLDIEDRGDIGDYLGINFNYNEDNTIELTQPQLIDQIIEQAKLKSKQGPRELPFLSSKILHRNEQEKKYNDKPFHYRSMIGKLNFLDKGSRPELSYAVHQCARFSSDPRQTHADAIQHICRYLKGTRDKGIIMKPDPKQSFKVHVDADFVGNYNKNTSIEDISTSKSRTGYVISYAGCPLIWSSKLQTQVALSTTEAEYIALLQALRETIPIMNLIKKLKKRNIDVYSTSPKIYCTAFEDNNGALELAKVPKMRTRTKHINIVYHHFRDFVQKGLIHVHPIDTLDQIAGIFTKPLDRKSFLKFRKMLMGW